MPNERELEETAVYIKLALEHLCPMEDDAAIEYLQQALQYLGEVVEDPNL